MRALSLRQASLCETAKHPTCRCRCGGKLHGVMRAGECPEPPREFFERLAEDDPHHVRSVEEKQRRARIRRAAAKARGQGLLWAMFTEEE